MIWSYPKLFNVGHLEVGEVLRHAVVVQEKVDGSQFSFARFGKSLTDVQVRSKGAVIDIEAPPALFKPAVDWVSTQWAFLREGHVYRAEALCKPKHNTLAYDRAPAAGFVLFDIERGEQDFLMPGAVAIEAGRLGVSCVPSAHYAAGAFTSDDAAEWLGRTSMFGGVKVEGFVIKAYGQYTRFNQTMMAKHVSEAFKEVHVGDWKQRNPGRKDVIAEIINDFGGPARWQKAIQHMEEEGKLTSSPQDIGPLIREIQRDLMDEEYQRIAAILVNHFIREIQGGVIKGFPEWYKAKLLERQFGD